MQNTKRPLLTKDARRTWEAAVMVSPEWLYKTNMCPPSDDEHATMKEMTVSVFLGRPLRAENTQSTEPACLNRTLNLLSSVEDIYLDSINLDLRDQFEERYALLAGETFELNFR